MDSKQTKVPAEFEPFFWDVHLKEIDLEKNKRFVIERLLNEGDQHTLKWLFITYSIEEIRTTVCQSRALTLKTRIYWKEFFQLKEEEMRCFSRSLMTPENPF